MTLPRNDKLRILTEVRGANATVVKIWGSGPFGYTLVSRFFSDDPWITAMDLAEGLPDSEDTVRRRLDDLVRVGRVRAAKRGRTTVYKANREWAEKTFRLVNSVVRADANCD